MSNLQITIDGHTYDITLDMPSHNGTGFMAEVNGQEVKIFVPDFDTAGLETEWMMVDGRPYELAIDPHLHWIKAFSGLHRLEIKDLDAVVSRPRSGDGRVKAPIPGLMTQIRVNVGDEVAVGQPILVLEAMKMENEIRAPRMGRVTAVHVTPGQTVVRGEVLVEIS